MRFQPKHGKYGTPIYWLWSRMISRCGNPKYKDYPNYGGRGIRVCERWKDFASFYADMGEKPPGMSIDRIENDGHYEPGNCRWATPIEQSNNRRSNHRVTINGVTQTISQWARQYNLHRHTLYGRIKYGWDESNLLCPSEPPPL